MGRCTCSFLYNGPSTMLGQSPAGRTAAGRAAAGRAAAGRAAAGRAAAGRAAAGRAAAADRSSLTPRPERLHAGLGDQPPGVDGRGERGVIPLVLVRVGGGEVRDGLVERIAFTEVGGDRDPVAPPGVRA